MDVREIGEGVSPRKATASPAVEIARVIEGELDMEVERDGGREFKSGAIVASFYEIG